MNSQRQSTFTDYTSTETPWRAVSSGHIQSIGWYKESPTLYFAETDTSFALGHLIGKQIRVTVSDDRICTNCGTESRRPPCSDCQGTPPLARCVYDPGTNCTYSTCPYPEYKAESCSHDHIVYLVAKEGPKVGITREGRREKRWREQGATHGFTLATAPNRKIAGIIEDACATIVSSRSPRGWYTPMDDPIDGLLDAAQSCAAVVPEALQSCLVTQDRSADELRDFVIQLEYPTAHGETQREIDTTALQTAGVHEGRVLGIRGMTIATDAFTLPLQAHRGRYITIELRNQ